MAEGFPVYNFESGSDKKKGRDRVGFNAPNIEKSRGDAPVGSKRFEHLFRPLEHEIKPPALKPEVAVETSRPGHSECEQQWRQPTPEELADLAAREARAEMYARHLQEIHAQRPEAGEDEDEDEDKPAKGGAISARRAVHVFEEPRHHAEKPGAAASGHAGETREERELASEAQAEADPTHDEFEAIMARAVPAEFAAAASGDRLTNEAMPEQSVADEVAEAPVQESFDTPLRPTAHERLSDDQAFQNMIENEFGETPGGASWHEAEPGEPPVSDSGEGADFPPPFRPTAEGGAWDNGDFGGRGQSVPLGWEMPAGGLASVATLMGMTGLAARHEMNSLKHTARKVGLAGAVGILGLGLVAEHLWNGHKRREMRRDFNQKTAKQNEALRQTDESLRQEQLAHQSTRSRLERLGANVQAQGVAAEQLHRSVMLPQTGERLPVRVAEAGLLGAVAAEELVRRAGSSAEISRPIDSQELARQLRNSRELGHAIERNPELRDALQQSNSGENGTQELREPVGASSYANALRDQRRFERKPSQQDDNSNAMQPGGGSIASDSFAFPAPQGQHDASGYQSLPQLNAPPDDQSARRSRLASPWTFAFAFFALVILLIALFVW